MDQAIVFKIQIPVKAYIRKYVLYQNDWVEPIPCSRRQFAGLMAVLLLEQANYHSHEPAERDSVLTFSLPEQLSNHHGKTLSNGSVYLFHNVMDAMFRQELFSYVRIIEKKKGQIKEAIDLMKEKYRLEEDDFSYDTFRKTIYRERRNGNQNKVKKIFETIVP